MAAKFELKSAKGGKFMFILKAANGKVILSSESYDTKKAAVKGVEAVKKNAANEKRFEKKVAKNGRQYFILKAANGEPIGRSETCTSAKSVRNGVASVMQNAPEARVDDLSV